MMHEGEVVATAAQVRALLAAQFPEWAGLELSAVKSAGTDNAIFQLGADRCVRLPRVDYAEAQIDKECAWLPKLGPLPLEVPRVLGRGEPGEGFPWRWAVCGWIDGETVSLERIGDVRAAAEALGGFVAALQRIDPAGGPAAGPATRGRGLALETRDVGTRKAIGALSDLYDERELAAAWDRALAAAEYAGAPVWIHADLHEGNLLQRDGRLVAVIDFGLLGVGDPAVDLTAAWTFLPAAERCVFREQVQPDEAMWARARGWALSIAVIALAYYRETNPVLVRLSERTITAVLADR